jgi:curved DNA-binding protein CbpA
MPECDKNSPFQEEEDESFYRLTFYEVLGVSEGATADDIKVRSSQKIKHIHPHQSIGSQRAYKRGILEYHPDKNTSLDATIATKRFRRIHEAYEVRFPPTNPLVNHFSTIARIAGFS